MFHEIRSVTIRISSSMIASCTTTTIGSSGHEAICNLKGWTEIGSKWFHEPLDQLEMPLLWDTLIN